MTERTADIGAIKELYERFKHAEPTFQVAVDLANRVPTLIADLEAAEVECATHRISASYYPTRGFVDVTWDHLESEERMELTIDVTPEQGEWFRERIGTSVYYKTKAENPLRAEVERLKELIKELVSRDHDGQWIFIGLRIDHPELTQARQPTHRARKMLDELHEAQAALEDAE